MGWLIVVKRIERMKIMPDIAIMTDSNCGILPEEGREMGITVVPMPIQIDGKTYLEGVDITADTFYDLQAKGASVTSSQPAPGEVMEMWYRLLKKHEEIVYSPMSSALSNSCQSASIFAQEFEGRVHVVNNRRISITQIQSVKDAMCMAEQGMSGAQIKETLEAEAMDATIYIAVDTLEYLKKGGRVTAAGAAIGSVLNIKPVLTIQGDKLDAYAKVRGMKTAFRTMCKALHNDVSTRLKGLYDSHQLMFGIANTAMEPEVLEHWIAQMQEEFPGEEITHSPLMLSIGCHTGPAALGIGAYRKH